MEEIQRLLHNDVVSVEYIGWVFQVHRLSGDKRGRERKPLNKDIFGEYFVQ